MDKIDSKRAAIELYRKKEASIGYCAEIAGMCEEDFIKLLGQNKIGIFEFDDKAEVLNEIKNA